MVSNIRVKVRKTGRPAAPSVSLRRAKEDRKKIVIFEKTLQYCRLIVPDFPVCGLSD